MNAEIMIQTFKDILEYEKDESALHKESYQKEIDGFVTKKEHNELILRYLKPLL